MSLDNSLINNGSNGVPKMKSLILLIAVYLVLFLAVFSVLFVIGCQENTITGPPVTEFSETQSGTSVTADKNLPQDYKKYPNIIKFKRVLNLANSPNTYFIVAGTIKVDQKIHNPDSNPPSEEYRVTVSLAIDAEMNEMEYGRTCWFIKESTKNTVDLAKGEEISLVKYYKVKGRSDEMLLACKFEFTLDGVDLQGMWITFSKVPSANCVAQ